MDTVRRVRAARGSLNLSLDKFAKLIHMGRTTLIRIENGTREPEPHEFQAMADATGLPLEFFTVEDLHTALAGEPARPDELAAINKRLTAAHERIDELADSVLALQALATERLLTDAATATAQAEGSRATGEPGRPRPTAGGSTR